MVVRTAQSLEALYEQDETAWLDESAFLIASGRIADLDYVNLQEYLLSMARRDRREVLSRLIVLLAHLFKWDCQPSQRSGSWCATIIAQRQELQDLLESRTLLNHAQEIFEEACAKALERAAAETGLDITVFLAARSYTLDTALRGELS